MRDLDTNGHDPAKPYGRVKPNMSLDQWWCPSPCATANRSFRSQCRFCSKPEPIGTVRSALYAIPEQYK